MTAVLRAQSRKTVTRIERGDLSAPPVSQDNSMRSTKKRVRREASSDPVTSVSYQPCNPAPL